MNKNYYLTAFILIFACAASLVTLKDKAVKNEVKDFFASVFFVESVNSSELQRRFVRAERGRDKIKILVVPGHDNVASGTVFNTLHEADLTVKLGEEIFDKLKTDKAFEVYLSRDSSGYTFPFTEYFETKRQEIISFMNLQRKMMKDYVDFGLVKSSVIMDHNYAPAETAIKLYGINKWANDNDIDLVIHIHFNDYPRKKRSMPGIYSGFSIYVPEKQYSNSKASRDIALNIFNELKEEYSQSNLPLESSGVIDDQELIAIGSNNSLDGASVLVEYGYIYENHIANQELQEATLEKMSEKTYEGIVNFFKNNGKEFTSKENPNN